MRDQSFFFISIALKLSLACALCTKSCSNALQKPGTHGVDRYFGLISWNPITWLKLEKGLAVSGFRSDPFHRFHPRSMFVNCSYGAFKWSHIFVGHAILGDPWWTWLRLTVFLRKKAVWARRIMAAAKSHLSIHPRTSVRWTASVAMNAGSKPGLGRCERAESENWEKLFMLGSRLHRWICEQSPFAVEEAS